MRKRTKIFENHIKYLKNAFLALTNLLAMKKLCLPPFPYPEQSTFVNSLNN